MQLVCTICLSALFGHFRLDDKGLAKAVDWFGLILQQSIQPSGLNISPSGFCNFGLPVSVF